MNILPAPYETWAQQAAPYFREQYGLSKNFALPAARLYVALWGYGLNPRITSGFRDPKKQAEMRAAWDRGDRAGLRVRPADPKGSLHCKTGGFLSSPAAEAIDMPCNDDRLGAQVASSLGLRAGYSFSTPDPGHYDAGGL